MKILSLELYNFRQYYGKQKIIFANQDDQNTTIIFGENGKGKTGIYRALMFSLFGTTNIPQDNKNKNIDLVNHIHLEDNTPGLAEACVTVEFEHEEEYYILTRKMLGTQRSPGNIKEQPGDSELRFKDTNGNILPKVYTDNNEIRKIINQILDEEIKDFFLFDAEKIDTLTKEDTDARKQVKGAILNLLQMNNVEDAKKVILEEKKNIENKLRNDISDQELNALEFKKTKLGNSISEKKELLGIYENEIEESNKTIDEHTLTLNRNEKIGKINEKIVENNQSITDYKNQLNKISNDIGQIYFKLAPYLILQQTLGSNSKKLRDFLGDARINVPLEIIEESLSNDSCLVCDTDLESNERNRKFAEALIESYSHSETYNFAKDIQYMYDHRKDQFEEQEDGLNRILKEFISISDKIDELLDINEELNKQVADYSKVDIDLSTLKEMVSIAEMKKKENERKYYIEENSIEELQRDKTSIERQLNEMYSTKSRNENEQKKFEFIKSLEKNLNDISTEFNDEMKELLGKETTEIFRTLIDKKDKELIGRVEINDKFEIKVFDNSGYRMLSNLSQGQSHVLALSFISALARIAVKEQDSDTIDFPLFIDSPLNRLSGDNRDQLIDNLPRLTSQLILLLTDTEYTGTEELVFKKNGRLGKSYRINQIDLKHSIIEEVDLDETLATRG